METPITITLDRTTFIGLLQLLDDTAANGTSDMEPDMCRGIRDEVARAGGIPGHGPGRLPPIPQPRDTSFGDAAASMTPKDWDADNDWLASAGWGEM